MTLEQGTLGDAKSVDSGVMELRLKFGKGYRIYFGQDGGQITVLLVGGDKSTQDKDIGLAYKYWADYLRRKRDGKKSK